MRKAFINLSVKVLVLLTVVSLLVPSSSLANGKEKKSSSMPDHVHQTALQSLSIQGAELDPPFSTDILNYKTTVNGHEKVDLNIKAAAKNAKVTINGKKVNANKAVQAEIPNHQNIIEIEVATPHRIKQTYTVVVQKENEYELQDVTLIQTGEGSSIHHYQLGFFPARNMDGVEAYLLFYSKEAYMDVWNYVRHLSPTEIEAHLTSNTSGEHKDKIYKISNLSYADGVGNTFREGQLDIITGKPLEVGEYVAYAATLGANEVLGMSEADRKIEIKPFPMNVEISGEGKAIENYVVTFDHPQDSRVTDYFIFYSEDGLTRLVEPKLEGKTKTHLKELVNQGRGKLVSRDVIGNNAVNFMENQLTIDGQSLGTGLYYAYVLAVGEAQNFGMAKSLKMINTNPMPKPLSTIGDGKGTLIPAGGSTSNVSAYFEAIRLATSVDKPRIAIFNSSRDSVEIAYDHFHLDDPPYKSLKEEFENWGFEPVYIPLAIDTYEFIAHDPYFVNLVKSSHAVMLQGGDQVKHARSLLNDDGSPSPLLQAIKYVYENGGVVAGTSAGAHVMSQPMFGVGDSLTSITINQTEEKTLNDVPLTGFLNPTISGNNLFMPGIGLAEDILFDTHFDARGRLGRLLVGMRDTGHTLGIGLDEGTGLQMKGDMGEVVGLNGVFILDRSDATVNHPGTKPGFETTGVRVHYLTSGDLYNFSTKEVIPAQDKRVVNSTAIDPYSSQNLFGGSYETTKSLISFAESLQEDFVTEIVHQTNYQLTWSRDEHTKNYTSDENFTISALRAYQKPTIINMILDLAPQDNQVEPQPVLIESVKTYSYNDTFFIQLSGPIEPNSVTKETIDLKGLTHVSWSPDYLSESFEIEVRVTEDIPLDYEITIQNLKDSNGNELPTETWRKVGGENTDWEKVSE
ncbi:cyanophycinase [Alkalihalobacterium sp. APHAB7]|uniref:cyanophycinase n=1 Tax=Alkalihalobacterium sp. APHAB7 TaxID=3402081 RepID=UPI003AAFBBF0